MAEGELSEFFEHIAAKRISAVEANPKRSRQHEFAVTRGMTAITGIASEPTPVPTTLMYLSDESEPVTAHTALTLYDARRKKPLRAAEYRFYFKSNPVTDAMREGDLFILARVHDGRLLGLIVQDGTTIASQLRWLLGLDAGALLSLALGNKKSRRAFEVHDSIPNSTAAIDVAARLILDQIGLEVEQAAGSDAERVIRELGAGWPTTAKLSTLARKLVGRVDAVKDPDGALMAWVAKEYVLFRALEKHLITERLDEGFNGESAVEDFLRFSLEVQNRRKSRSGYSLELQIEAVLKANNVKYKRGAVTEGKSKPDFLFPGISEYKDPGFDRNKLTMLASKRSAKDRWRQILAEASEIRAKHLFTLEPAISVAQTDEMFARSVTLVLPAELHSSFSEGQRPTLVTLKEFIARVKVLQS